MAATETDERIKERIIAMFEDLSSNDTLSQEQILRTLDHSINQVHVDRLLAELCTPKKDGDEELDATLVKVSGPRSRMKWRYARNW